jgi:hypothetical protein
MAFSSTFVRKVLPCFSRKDRSAKKAQRCPNCACNHHQDSQGARKDSRTHENLEEKKICEGSHSEQGQRNREEDATTRTSLTKVTNRLMQQDSLRSQPLLDQIEESPHESPIVSRGNTVLWDYNPFKDKFKSVTQAPKHSPMKSCRSLPHMALKNHRESESKCTSV